jgi:hypothetical protein
MGGAHAKPQPAASRTVTINSNTPMIPAMLPIEVRFSLAANPRPPNTKRACIKWLEQAFLLARRESFRMPLAIVPVENDRIKCSTRSRNNASGPITRKVFDAIERIGKNHAKEG